jgi:hypothetical protein
LTAIALTGMFGRFPVLFTHVYVLQNGRARQLEHVARRLLRVLVEAADGRVADERFCGLIATSWIGRFGSFAFAPVTFTQSRVRRPGAEAEAVLHVAVVRADDRVAVRRRRVVELVDVRAVASVPSSGRAVRVPARRRR